MALTNRYSCLALLEFLLTEYQFQIHHIEKGHPETPVKFGSPSNGRIKSYGPYEPLLLPGATRVPPHRVSIPNPPYRKRASGNSSKIWIAIQRSDQKLWPLTNRYSCLARRDFLHTENRFHIHYMEEGHPETPVKFRSRSNGRIKSYGPYEPLLFPGATRVPPHRVSIPNPP